MSNKPEPTNRPPLPSREKYALAFQEGAEVIVHTEHGDELHRVRRRADGTFEWTKLRDAKPGDAA